MNISLSKDTQKVALNKSVGEPLMQDLTEFDQDQQEEEEDSSLTYWEGVITNLAVIIGAGIGVMPNAFYKLGVIPGLGVVFAACLQTINQAWLYLEAKDNIPGELESLFEIGFYLIGNKFIYVISGIILVLSYGESIARLHVVGKIL